MSGLLDRMVQRVRGGLAGIEPLVRSDRTAAQLGGMHPGAMNPGAMGGPVEQNVETVRTTAQRGTAGAEMRTRLEARTGKDAAARAADHGDVSGPVRRDSVESSGRDVSRQRADSEDAEFEKRESSAVRGRARGADLDEKAGDVTVQDGDRSGLREGRLPAEPAAIATRVRSEDVAPDAKGAADAVRDAREEEKTEITISIGSVELRAPRTAVTQTPAAAPRAAFRPRLTLEEYLGRGSRSGEPHGGGRA